MSTGNGDLLSGSEYSTCTSTSTLICMPSPLGKCATRPAPLAFAPAPVPEPGIGESDGDDRFIGPDIGTDAGDGEGDAARTRAAVDSKGWYPFPAPEFELEPKLSTETDAGDPEEGCINGYAALISAWYPAFPLNGGDDPRVACVQIALAVETGTGDEDGEPRKDDCDCEYAQADGLDHAADAAEVAEAAVNEGVVGVFACCGICEP